MTKPSAKAREIAEAILRAVPGMTPEAVESSASLPAMAALIDAHLADVREEIGVLYRASRNADWADEYTTRNMLTDFDIMRGCASKLNAALATLTPEKDDE